MGRYEGYTLNSSIFFFLREMSVGKRFRGESEQKNEGRILDFETEDEKLEGNIEKTNNITKQGTPT